MTQVKQQPTPARIDVALAVITGAINGGLKHGLFDLEDAKQIAGALEVLKRELARNDDRVSDGSLPDVISNTGKSQNL